MIKPINDKVIVKRAEAKDKTAGGIMVHSEAQEVPNHGIVIKVGNGKLLDDGSRLAMQVKKGDEVLFNSFAGTEVEFEGVKYLVMIESNILAVLERVE